MDYVKPELLIVTAVYTFSELHLNKQNLSKINIFRSRLGRQALSSAESG